MHYLLTNWQQDPLSARLSAGNIPTACNIQSRLTFDSKLFPLVCSPRGKAVKTATNGNNRAKRAHKHAAENHTSMRITTSTREKIMTKLETIVINEYEKTTIRPGRKNTQNHVFFTNNRAQRAREYHEKRHT
jgi:hypothetical protein